MSYVSSRGHVRVNSREPQKDQAKGMKVSHRFKKEEAGCVIMPTQEPLCAGI